MQSSIDGDWIPAAVVAKEIEFDAGHRVPFHRSKCRSPHGHRYRVRAHVLGPIQEKPGESDDGMVVDFGDLKRLLTEVIHDPLDHGFIVYKDDKELMNLFGYATEPEPSLVTGNGWKVIPFPYVPTAENIARWCFEQLHTCMPASMQLVGVMVWETPTSCAIYEGQEMIYEAQAFEGRAIEEKRGEVDDPE